MAADGRQEYVPGRRAASAGRTRPLSASMFAGGMDGSSPLFSSMPPGGFRPSRPISAVGTRSPPQGSSWAWGSPSEGGAGSGGLLEGTPTKRVHVQALAGAKGREQLAEDVVSLREQVSKLKTHLSSQTVEKRRVEQELLRTKSSLLKAEELLNTKERTMGSPNMGISQLYRSPDTTHLVGNLKQQVVEHKATSARLDAELRSLQRSLRATKVSELQAELFAMTGEVERLSRLTQQSSKRMQDAEAAAKQALADAAQARALQLQQGGEGVPRSSSGSFMGDLSSGGGRPASGSSSLRRTLQAMYQAHQVLLHEAEQLRAVFPGGLGMKEFVARARQNNNTAGAPDVLNFLRNHMAKLSTELSGQPGAPAGGSPTKETKTSSSSPSRTTPPTPAAAPAALTGPDLMQSVADAVRKLRMLSERKWRDSPTLQIDSEQLSDIMALYVDEVRRLQGKGPATAAPALQAETTSARDADLDKALSETQRLQSAAKAAQSDLASSQADLAAAQGALSTTKTDLAAAQRELGEWRRKAEALEAKESSLKTQLATLNQQLKEAVASSGGAVKEAATAAAAPAAAAPDAPPEGTVPWQVVVHTSDVSGGAFDGSVYIMLNGTGYKSSGELLLPSDRYSFDCGQADKFTIHVPTEQLAPEDEVFSVGLRMGYSEAGDVTWHVAKVEVMPPPATPGAKPGPTKAFQFNDWLRAGPLNMLFPRVGRDAQTVEYEVQVRTSDYRGASADAQVYLTLVGDQGAAPEVLLEPSMLLGGTDTSRFLCRGTTCKLSVRAADVGDLSHAVVRLAAADGSTKGVSWALEDLRVIHAGTGMGSMFYHYSWLSSDEPRATLTEAYTWQAWSQFTVKVLTSKLPGADFDGAVYLTMHGERGSSNEFLLAAKPGAKGHSFKCGAADVFKTRGEEVGALTSVTLRLAPTSQDNLTWNITTLSVTNEDNGDAAVFNADAWLTGETSVTLYKDTPQAEYKVTVVAASNAAAFSGAVFATFSGSCGSSAEVQLVNDSCKGGNDNVATFEPAGMQEFVVKERDVGVLQSLTLRVAPMASRAAAGEALKLDRVQVVMGAAPDKVIKFAATEALQATAADGGSLSLQRSLATTEYRVQVVTCDSPDDSGFDGQVYIKLHGQDGTSEEVQLANPLPAPGAAAPAPGETAKGPFSLNTTSSFTIQAGDVGVLTSIEVRMEKTGSEYWWRPNRLEVTHPTTNQLAVFRYNSWMNAWSSSYTLEQQTQTTYKVVLHASPAWLVESSSGGTTKPVPFKGKVFVKLSNYQGESEEVEVPLAEPLVPGGTAVLPALKCRVGWVAEASVRVEGATPLHLRMVEALADGASSSTYLPCHQWLGPGFESQLKLENYSMCDYKLSVFTGRGKEGALPGGASLFVTLLDGSGQRVGKEEAEVKLPEGGIPAGTSTELPFSTFSLYLSEVAQVQLRVEGVKGSWALQRASVWLPSSSDPQLLFSSAKPGIALPGSMTLSKARLQQYSISVTTSEQRGADSDGVVMVRLLGDSGETEDLRMSLDDSVLSTWYGSALNLGGTDTYTVQAADVGALQQVVVRLAPKEEWNAAARSRWHLTELTVTHGGSGLKSHFPHNGWVATDGEVTLDAKSSEQTYVDYTITLVTGYTGFYDGDVLTTLSDDSGTSTQPITLRGSDAVQETTNHPTQGSLYQATYSVRGVDLCSIAKAQVQLAKGGSSYYMLLKRLQVVNQARKQGALFKVDNGYLYNWNDPTTYDVAPSEVYTRVDVRTKNFPDAGLEGDVYITLHGEEGDAPEICMCGYSFDPDCTTYYWWYAPNIGNVQAVSVWTEAAGSRKKWALDYVEVYNLSKGTSAIFEHTGGDIQPGADKRVRIPKREKAAQYEITAVTSDVRGAGCDGCLWVVLEGETGSTPELKLFDSAEDLARNSSHTFKVSAPDVGEVRTLHVRVGLPTEDGPCVSGWHASQVEVLNMSSGLKCAFGINKWINADEYACALPQSSCEQALQTYRVQVTTSSMRDASFDGVAYLTLNGWYTSSDELLLAAPGRSTASFSAGSTQEFVVRARDVGSYIPSVQLRMVPTASDPKWHVAKVAVLSDDPATRPTMEFFHNNWLSQDCTQATLSTTCAPAKYQVTLAIAAPPAAASGDTSSTPAPAAWDGQVFITFNGQYSSAPETELVNDAVALEPGVAQEYDVDSVNLGGLSSVSLRLAGGSEGRSLKLDRIQVTDKETGRRTEFVYIDAITPGSRTITVPAYLKETDFRVTLVTNPDAGNSTPFDGDVYLTLYGMNGDGQEVKLQAAAVEGPQPPPGVTAGVIAAKPTLSDGSSVALQMKAGDVGQLRYANLRLDFNGACTQYTLSSLELTHVESGMTTRLPCSSCLNSSWCTNTTLYPQTSTTYKVRVTTGSDTSAPPFDGNVYLTLSNWYTNGKEVALQNEKGADAFKPEAVEEFSITCSDLSYVSQVAVRVEAAPGGSKQPKWQLAIIEVWDTSCTSATPNGFLHNEWLVAGDADKAQASLSSRSLTQLDKVEVVMGPSSGPFNGSLWLSIIDSQGKASNEVQVLCAGDQVLAPDSTATLNAASLYFSDYGGATAVLRAADNTASSQAWQPSLLRLSTTSGGSLLCYEAGEKLAGVVSAGTVSLARVPDVEYEVVVVGADVPGNGTDANIVYVLEGQRGSSSECYLWGDHERGGTDTATTSLPDLGPLKRVTVFNRDPGNGIHSKYCVGELRVTQQGNGQRTSFECGASGTWVERGGSATFEAAKTTCVFTDYKVTIYTSAASGSGFDGSVRFKMESTDSKQTSITPLGKGDLVAGPFKTGGQDTFTVKGMAFDDLARVMVDLDYSGSTSCWTIARVVVERPDTSQVWQFTPSGAVYNWSWFPAIEATPTVYYDVQVYTTTLDKSAFDGSVYFTLVGENGDGKEVSTSLSSYDLSPGNTAYTYMYALDVGRLKSLRVRTEGGSVGRWPLGYVRVTNPSTGAVAMFEAPQQGSLKAGSAVVLPRVITSVQYEVTVYTMDERGAGTDGDVYLKLCGPNGNTDEVRLYNSEGDFQRGAVNTFTFTGPDVGDNPTVELRLACPAGEGALVHSGWALDRVEVLHTGTGLKGTYPYGSWLNMPQACAVLTQASSQQALHKYRVRVTTGSLPGAGFDGAVYLSMSGWYGSVPETRLAVSGQTTAHLKEGETAEFEVRGPDIGRVSCVTLRLEPTEEDPAWLLDNVEVVAETGDYTSSFFYNDWLNQANKQVEVWSNNPHITYKVVVITTDQADAGFDGDVYLVLAGTDGRTSEVQLLSSSDASAEAAPFLAGSSRECVLRASDVASLRSATLRTVASRKDKKWHLDRLEVSVLPPDGSDPAPAVQFIHRGWVEENGTVEVARFLPTTEYKLTLATTDQPDAGFDGNVFITIQGTDGSTEELKLALPAPTDTAGTAAPAPAAAAAAPAAATPAAAAGAAVAAAAAPAAPAAAKLPLAPGSSVTVPVSGVDVGKISSVSVRIESSGKEGALTSWHLNSVGVLQTASGAAYTFPYRGYIHESSGSYSLYMPSSYTYQLKVYTSAEGSDFDGNVYIKLGNYWSTSYEEVLAASRTTGGVFKPGSCEEFTIKVNDVGWLSSIQLRTEQASGSGASKWHCSHIEASSDSGGSWQFHVHDVIAAGAEARSVDVQSMSRCEATLWLAPAEGVSSLQLEDLQLYAQAAGTDADTPAWAESKLELVPLEPEPGVPAVAGTAAYKASFMQPNLPSGSLKLQIRAAAGSSGTKGAKWQLVRAKLWDDYNWNATHFFFGASLAAAAKLTATSLATEEYDVVVYTSDVRGNGHDGTASIVLEGLQCVTGETSLDGDSAVQPAGGSSATLFERGGVDVFRVSMPDLGKLRNCYVKLVGGHSQWRVDKLEVVHRASGATTTFACAQWLQPYDSSTSSGPAYTCLPAGDPSNNVLVDWDVDVWTATAPDAAFDGEMSLQLFDAKGRSTCMMRLGSGTDDGMFKVGGHDVVRVRGLPLADLHHACVRLNQTGSSSTWVCLRVQASCKATGATGVFSGADASVGVRVNCYGEVQLEEAPRTSYSVQVWTGAGDSMECKAYLTLHGGDGSSKEVPLQCWGSWPRYWANDWRNFSLEAYDVGVLKAVTVRCEECEGSDMPTLESVRVTKDSTSVQSTFMWQKAFPANSQVTIQKQLDNTKWQLQTFTADYRGAGTDGDVYVVLKGDDGDMPEFKLSSSSGETFRRGRTDTFTFPGVVLGGNKTITLRLAGAGGQAPHSSWNLTYCTLTDLNSGDKTVFYHYGWVGVDAPAVLRESYTTKGLYPYKLTVTTGSAKEAGFEGEVWVKLGGWYGESPELLLAPPDATSYNFVPGAVDVFDLKAEDLGEVTSVQIARVVPANGSETAAGWQLESLQVLAVERGGDPSLFEYSNWVTDSSVPTTLYRSGPNIPYKLLLHTAAASPAVALTQPLLITLKGLLGECDENKLVSETDSGLQLVPGGKLELGLKDSDVGALTQLTLALKQQQEGEQPPTWVCDKVEVVVNDPPTTTALFPAAAAAGSGQPAPSWQLVGGKWTLALARLLPEAQYTVAVTTTDLADALFDGDVVVTLTGSEGTTGEVRLPADKPFNPGQRDSFSLKAADVGALTSVTVALKPKTGGATQWHLADLSVAKGASSGAPPFKFTCNSYLNECNPSVTLYQQGPCKYNLTLVTTDKPEAAGFAGDVYMSLCGQYGVAPEVQLTPANPPAPDAPEAMRNAATKACALEPGNAAAWVLSAPADVGPLTSAKIRVVPAPGSANTKWHCARVVVRSERDPDNPHVLTHDNWIKGGEEVTVAAKKLVGYSMEVVLPDSLPAGGVAPSAPLRCTLVGPEGATSEVVTINPPSDSWQPGANTVAIEATDVGTLAALRVEAAAPDPKAASSGGAAGPAEAARAPVPVRAVKLYEKGSTSLVAAFSPAASAAGAVLQPGGAAATLEALQQVTYKVEVTTADARGAGTNGSVSVVLLGDRGTTPALSLSSDWWYDFERGRTDSFEVATVDVGTLAALKVELDASAQAGWLLDSVRVTNSATGQAQLFKHGAWLGPRAASCVATLSPSGKA